MDDEWWREDVFDKVNNLGGVLWVFCVKVICVSLGFGFWVRVYEYVIIFEFLILFLYLGVKVNMRFRFYFKLMGEDYLKILSYDN